MSQIPDQRGGEPALEAFLSESWDDLYKIVRRRLPDHAAAEDVRQETAIGFTLHWRRSGSIPTDRRLRVLHTIAKYKCFDYYRRLYREREQVLPPGNDATHERLAELADHTAEDSAPRLTESVFIDAGLNRRQRQAVELVDLDGLDQTSAAAAMGMTVRGLQDCLRAGRAKLTASLTTTTTDTANASREEH